MAAFKKSLLVLAVAIIALAGAGGTAFAQHPSVVMTCVASAVPAQSRAEGIAELLGDLIAQCTIPNPPGSAGFAPSLQANVTVTLNVNVTNNKDFGLGSSVTDAVLIVNETFGAPTATSTLSATPNTPVPQYGTLVASSSLQWSGVTLPTPGATGNLPVTTIRISNMRGNVSQLGIPTGEGVFPTAQVTAFLSISSATAIPVTNNVLNIGVPLLGLNVRIRGPNDTDVTLPIVALQCVTQNISDSSITNTDTNHVNGAAVRNDGSFSIRLLEGYAAAFKTLGLPTNTPATAFAEDGFGTPPSGVNGGGATQGTRFILRFYNVPSGVRLATPAKVTGTPASGHTLTLFKVPGTDANGAGALNTTVGASLEVTITGGFGFVVYEVTDSNPFIVEQAIIPVTVAYTANTASDQPAVGTMQASGAFAPLSTVTTANKDAPEPRFVDTGKNVNIYTISRCITNLLFPFVTNQAGFDTGIAIANTSADDKGTKAQAGTCTLYYFGSTTGGGAAPPNATSAVVASGKTITWTLSAGNPTASIAGAPGFQGYIFAQCQFQFAHGFAFITDGFGGVPAIAEGYLALVVPWDGVAGDRGKPGAAAAESLGH